MKKMSIPFLVFLLLVTGCASYITPGSGVSLSELSDESLQEIYSAEPKAQFPAKMAVVRIQAPGYQSYRLASFGDGRYSVVTTREVETEEDFKRISSLSMVAGLAPLNRILLPTKLDSIKSLREAAARLKTDVLMIYTFDTSFHAGEQKFAPLNAVALGFLKNKKVTVTTTVSAAIFDVRTEYLYGLAEATAIESKRTSVWGEPAAVDDLRVVTERSAFEKLIPEIEVAWKGIVTEYAASKE